MLIVFEEGEIIRLRLAFTGSFNFQSDQSELRVRKIIKFLAAQPPQHQGKIILDDDSEIEVNSYAILESEIKARRRR